MTKTELSAFRRTLNDTRTELENGNRNRDALAIETSADELDRIQHASDRDYAMSYLERTSNRLREVRMALGRIDAGTYAICSVCEENINPKRLAAIPWASACTACQEAAERERNTIPSEVEPSLGMAA